MNGLRIDKSNYAIITVLLASLITLSPFAIDSYLAAMPLMANYFGVNISLIELTITLYFLGFAVGNFFGGPLSDSFGRKPIALIGVGLYAVTSLCIPYCPNIELILVLRVIQAFGGGFATVTSNVFIRDWYQGKQVAKLITITSMIMMLAPLFAPIIGATLIHFNGWQAVFYFLFAFASVLFVAFWILIPESRDKSFITNKITANQLLDKYKLFFSDKQSVIFLFSISFSMAGMYVFITNASFIYINYFKIEQNIFPLFFGTNIVLNIILSLLNSYLLKFYPPVRLLKAGLFLQLLSGVLLLITVQFESPWLYAFFGGIVLYIGSLGLIFGNGTAVILDHNPQVSGSANATLGIFRFVLSFLIGSIIVLFHSGNLIPVGTALFICTFTGNVLFMVANRSEKKMN